MPLPKNRSTSVRKIYKRIPTGKTIHYKRVVKGKKHYCALSGEVLPGVTSRQSTAKSAKRPNRKLGQPLEPDVHAHHKDRLARQGGAMPLSGVEIRLLPYVKRYLASGE